MTTVELETLHRFEHDWEATASLELREGDAAAVDAYDRHGHIHGHANQAAAIDAVADVAFAGIVEGRDVLVMAPTNVIVEQLNTTITGRLLDTGHLDPDRRIDIGDCVFYPGQAVVTRASPTEPRAKNGCETATAGKSDPVVAMGCASHTPPPDTTSRSPSTTSPPAT